MTEVRDLGYVNYSIDNEQVSILLLRPTQFAVDKPAALKLLN